MGEIVVEGVRLIDDLGDFCSEVKEVHGAGITGTIWRDPEKENINDLYQLRCLCNYSKALFYKTLEI